ncbi:MAG: PorT family protein [Flavobacteriaceae bacterium]|nr:PorT family protein [Flavobacteriaceae bacterium]
MKNFILPVLVCLFSISILQAQDVQFGVTAGYIQGFYTLELNGQDLSPDGSGGFQVGGLVDIGISDAFHLQPEVLYININDGSGLLVPLMAKYYFGENFNIQGGPMFDFALEEIPEDYTSLGISAALGFGYDFTENWFAQSRFGFQLNDYYNGDADISSKSNILTVGVGYKF